jgi:hypothetical protein
MRPSRRNRGDADIGLQLNVIDINYKLVVNQQDMESFLLQVPFAARPSAKHGKQKLLIINSI